jgi:myo-inositol-1(or 4)-monophosphatase
VKEFSKSDLEYVFDTVRHAGKILCAGFGSGMQVERKSAAIDLVTEYDRKSEAFLIEKIQARFPRHRILAEESGLNRAGDDPCWVIDPLDGTTNFAHGLPIFSISVALVENGNSQLGIVFDPTREECFWAQRGQGAFLGDQPLHARKETELQRSLLVTGFAYDAHTNPVNNFNHFADFSKLTRGVRRLGSAAIDLSYVAAGRLDGYWELQLSAWDIAAGALIAQEAGAKVTDVQGGELSLAGKPSILAANPNLHARMLEVLRSGLS